jgi:hypothetical protein
MILRKTAMFIRDLLAYDEQLIRVGRQGYDIDDFTIGYIAVDTLGPAQRLGGGEVFDPVAEVMEYQEQWRAPVTISFFGDGAWQRATDFSLLLRSQKAYELQDLLGIGVYLTSGLTDVKMLTGQQYGERQELTVNVQHSSGINISTLRIDTEQIELTT